MVVITELISSSYGLFTKYLSYLYVCFDLFIDITIIFNIDKYDYGL